MSNIGLGSCCICGREENVRNVIQLHFKAPMPGRGWGCFVCGLPSDGAVAVICDYCFKFFPHDVELKFACRGYPASDGRIPIAKLTGEHEHDMAFHEEGN